MGFKVRPDADPWMASSILKTFEITPTGDGLAVGIKSPERYGIGFRVLKQDR
jgi:hypothetical protein